MAGENLVVVTHLSTWMEKDSAKVKPHYAEYLGRILTDLERPENGFGDVWNIARALSYDLSEENLRNIRAKSLEKIEQCDALIKFPQIASSETLGEDTGYAMGLGKKVLIVAGEEPLSLTDQEDIKSKDVKKYAIQRPLDPEEIRSIIN